MNIPSLEEFNNQIAQYTSNLAVDKGDIESILDTQLSDKVSALKEKGQALLEGFLPTAELAKYGLDTAGLSITDIPDLATSAIKGIGNIADSAMTFVSNVGQKISSAADTLATGFGGGDTSIQGLASSLTRPATTAEPESIELSNLAASDAVSGVEGGLASGATDIAVSAGTDVAAATLEGVGAAADATGIGAIIGVPLGIIGAVLGGYSLVSGFEDLFKSSHSDNIAVQAQSALPNVSVPQFQAS
jgi:hypothetical protein